MGLADAVRPILIPALLVAVTGCATQGAVNNVNSSVWATHGRLESLMRQVAAIDSMVAAQGDTTLNRWTVLSTDVETMTRRLEEIQARLADVLRRMAIMTRAMEEMRIYGGSGVESLRPDGPDPAR